MRIAFLIGMLMMNAVRGHPENWSTLECQRGANGQKVFDPLVGLESAMCQQPVIRHADAETARDPPQEDRGEQTFPGEKEQRGHRSHMKQRHEYRRHPVDFAFCGLSSFQIFQLHIQRGPHFPCSSTLKKPIPKLSAEPERQL